MVIDFSLISANNGWVMAVTGAILVMLGLSALSLIISQLHKIIAFFETQTAPVRLPVVHEAARPEIDLIFDLEASAKLYKALSEDLGDRFDLTKLYQIAQKDQFPHPHLTLRTLRESGFLIPTGDGTFSWSSF